MLDDTLFNLRANGKPYAEEHKGRNERDPSSNDKIAVTGAFRADLLSEVGILFGEGVVLGLEAGFVFLEFVCDVRLAGEGPKSTRRLRKQARCQKQETQNSDLP